MDHEDWLSMSDDEAYAWAVAEPQTVINELKAYAKERAAALALLDEARAIIHKALESAELNAMHPLQQEAADWEDRVDAQRLRRFEEVPGGR